MLVALDATMEIAGPAGLRTIPMGDLYAGAERNAGAEAVVADDAVVTAIQIAIDVFSGQAFEKVTVRGANDFASASVVVAIAMTDGVVRDCRIVLGGAALRPVRSREAETAVIGRKAVQIVPADAAKAALPGAWAPDVAGRIDVLRTLIARTMAQAVAA